MGLPPGLRETSTSTAPTLHTHTEEDPPSRSRTEQNVADRHARTSLRDLKLLRRYPGSQTASNLVHAIGDWPLDWTSVDFFVEHGGRRETQAGFYEFYITTEEEEGRRSTETEAPDILSR